MKKSKKILLKWAATYGEGEDDVRASMYNEDMMIEFAKYYHKQKLTLTDVVSMYCDCDKYHDRYEEVNNNCNSCDRPIDWYPYYLQLICVWFVAENNDKP